MSRSQAANTVGRYGTDEHFLLDSNKRLRIMPVSDSPWAPTGFGTNTKNVAALLHTDGHHIGYGGCQNDRHGQWFTPWPLGQTEKEAWFETLPIMYPGQERFGEKSFPTWIKEFNPDVVLGHLDFQMFKHMTDRKQPNNITLPFRDAKGKILDRKQRMDMMLLYRTMENLL